MNQNPEVTCANWYTHPGLFSDNIVSIDTDITQLNNIWFLIKYIRYACF